jgi:hypothetical protein
VGKGLFFCGTYQTHQRTWKSIAEKASHERNSEKLIALVEELLTAIEEQRNVDSRRSITTLTANN